MVVLYTVLVLFCCCLANYLDVATGESRGLINDVIRVRVEL
jgi:hypothetical protein